jgi:hypothetical protein
MNGNIGSGIGTGVAMGISAGYLIGSSTERSKGRRISEEGKDQVLLLIKAPVEKVGEAIATLLDNWEYQKGKLIGHYPLNFGVTGAAIIGAVAGTVIFISLIFLDNHYNGLGTGFPGGLIGAAIATIAIGIAGEIILDRPHSAEISYIKIGSSKEYTTVLIKKYDGNGDRNLDEDDLLRLVEVLESVNPSENEVRKSLEHSKGQPEGS